MARDTDFPAPLSPAQHSKNRFAAPRTIMALMLREMSTRYGNSPGGYIWAILEPLGAILVLSLAFSLILRTPSLGNNFLLFYATGYIPMTQFQTISAMVAHSINFSRPLLMYPTVSWLDAVIARFILNALTGTMIMYILLTGILVFQETRSVLDMGPIVLATVLTALLGLGVGVMNCVLFGLFPVWAQVWAIITRPLFIASGVFYIYEDLPVVAQDFLWYNPLLHLTGLMRTGFYPTYTPTYINVAYVLGVSMVLITFGLLLLGRYHRDILNR